MGKRKKGIRISLSAAVVANSDSFFFHFLLLLVF